MRRASAAGPSLRRMVSATEVWRGRCRAERAPARRRVAVTLARCKAWRSGAVSRHVVDDSSSTIRARAASTSSPCRRAQVCAAASSRCAATSRAENSARICCSDSNWRDASGRRRLQFGACLAFPALDAGGIERLQRQGRLDDGAAAGERRRPVPRRERDGRGRADHLARTRGGQRREVARAIRRRIGRAGRRRRHRRRRAPRGGERRAGRSRERVVPGRCRRVPWHQRRLRSSGEPLVQRPQRRRDDRQPRRQRRRKCVRPALGYLRGEEQHVGGFARQPRRQRALVVLAEHRDAGVVRQRARRGAEHSKLQGQAASARVAGAGGDHVEPFFRRDAADRQHAHRSRRHRERAPPAAARPRPRARGSGAPAAPRRRASGRCGVRLPPAASASPPASRGCRDPRPRASPRGTSRNRLRRARRSSGRRPR